MLLKALPGKICIPESLYRGRDRRIDTIIICQDFVGLGSHHAKVFPCHLHMCCKLFFVVYTVQIFFSKRCHLCYSVLHTVKIIIKTPLSRYTQHLKQLIRFLTLGTANKNSTEHCGDYKSCKYHTKHCYCYSGS